MPHRPISRLSTRLWFRRYASVFSSPSRPSALAAGLASATVAGSSSITVSPRWGCMAALSSGSVTSTARLVSRMGAEKMVCVSGIRPMLPSNAWPLVEMSTGIVAEKPRLYIVKPV